MNLIISPECEHAASTFLDRVVRPYRPVGASMPNYQRFMNDQIGSIQRPRPQHSMHAAGSLRPWLWFGKCTNSQVHQGHEGSDLANVTATWRPLFVCRQPSFFRTYGQPQLPWVMRLALSVGVWRFVCSRSCWIWSVLFLTNISLQQVILR
jgi:hypothetical protein